MLIMTHASISMRQRGQAAAEALVVLLALAGLWFGIAWLGRLQDMGLHADHGVRHAAFLATRSEAFDAHAALSAGLFSGVGVQWQDLRGKDLKLSVYDQLDLRLQRGDTLPELAQVGGARTPARQLRAQWSLEDRGLLGVHLALPPRVAGRPLAVPGRLGLAFFDQAYPRLRRQIAIATDAGHSPDDASTARRIADSSTAWSSAVARSRVPAGQVIARMPAVDAAWNRPQAELDWLHAWAGDLPSWHLASPEGRP